MGNYKQLAVGILIVGLLMIAGCSSEVIKEPKEESQAPTSQLASDEQSEVEGDERKPHQEDRSTLGPRTPSSVQQALSDSIHQWVDQRLEGSGVHYQFSIEGIEQEFSCQGGNYAGVMDAASTIKPFIALAYYANGGQGMEADIRMMLSQSDNEATNRLIDYLGFEEINDYIQRLGAEHTILNRRMLEYATLTNQTTAQDLTTLLKRLMAVKTPGRSQILRAMTHTNTARTKLLAHLDYQVFKGINKSGENTGLSHDMAIIEINGKHYAVACLIASPQGEHGQVDTLAMNQFLTDFGQFLAQNLKQLN